GVARGFRASLAAGARFGLWQEVMLDWLAAMRTHHADISIRAEIGLEEDLMLGLAEGRLDLSVMYAPQSRPGLAVEPLFDDELVLVAPGGEVAEAPGPGHVQTDWSRDFFTRHEAYFPEFAGAGLAVNVGWLGLQHILRCGGSGYFPRRVVAPLVAEGR